MKRLTYSNFGSYDHVDADAGEINFSTSVNANRCPCCRSRLSRFVHQLTATGRSLHLDLCTACGWWHLHRTETFQTQDGKIATAIWWELHHAVFSEIELDSPSLPIEQLRMHLARQWKDRKHISAQQAEDLVASVLKEHYGGDILRLTANANAADGGIDLFVVSADGKVKRAVQVKRRQAHDRESVREVRNFVGAMLLHGADEGVFVTTASEFTEPAKDISKNANLIKHRLSLELIDGDRLLELLEHSNLALPNKLPPLVQLDSQWIASDGSLLPTSSLLFGELSRDSIRPKA